MSTANPRGIKRDSAIPVRSHDCWFPANSFSMRSTGDMWLLPATFIRGQKFRDIKNVGFEVGLWDFEVLKVQFGWSWAWLDMVGLRTSKFSRAVRLKSGWQHCIEGPQI